MSEEESPKYPPIPDGEVMAPLDKVPWIERTELLRSLEGPIKIEQYLEDVIVTKKAYDYGTGKDPIYTSASVFVQLRKLGARLPKYSKWAAGLFPKDPSVVTELSKYGKLAADRTFFISCRKEDILRSGNIGNSCLKWTGVFSDKRLESCIKAEYQDTWQYVLPAACAAWNGVATVIECDKTGKILGRTFLCAIKRKADGVEGIMAYTGQGTAQPLVEGLLKSIKEKWKDLLIVWAGGNEAKGNPVFSKKYEFIGCPPSNLHFDPVQYGINTYAQEVTI